MLWYPYEQMKTMNVPYHIVDAKGVYLYTDDQKMIDSVSSWWSVIHGYNHPVLNQAIDDQLKQLSQSSRARFRNEISYIRMPPAPCRSGSTRQQFKRSW